jgi:hypothetical protein
MRLGFVTLCLGLVGALSLPQLVNAAEDVKKAFLSEYAPAAQALRDQYTKNWQIKMVQTNYMDNGEIASKFELSFLCSDTCILAKQLLLVRAERREGKLVPVTQEPPKESWTLFRPDGLFGIELAKGSSDYVVNEMRLGKISWEAIADNYPLNLLLLPLGFLNHTVTGYIEQPTVTVLGVSKRRWHGRECTGLTVREATPEHEVRSRSFYFDTNDGWLLQGVQFGVKDPPGGTAVISYDYGRKQDGLAIPRKVECYIEKNGSSPKLRWITEYDQVEKAAPQDAEFSLQRFNLPEPAGATWATGPRWYLWLYLAAAVAAAVAILLFRFSKRKEDASRPKPLAAD